MQTAEEVYASAAADGARPDPLLTVSDWGTTTARYRNAPPPSRDRGARNARRTCARSWTAFRPHP